MKRNKISMDYDKKANVLYISFGEPVEAVTEEMGNVGIRIDEKTNEIVGITIINFINTNKKQTKNNLKIKYNEETDTADITSGIGKELVKKTVALNDDVVLDFDSSDMVIRIEILSASKHLNKKTLLQELV